MKQDSVQALELYKRGAEKGNAVAMMNLAKMYRQGKGCEVNLQKAIIYFSKAAEKGNDAAMVMTKKKNSK